MKHLPKIPFYFLRHGETDWNRQRRVMGQKDIPLNEKGIEQAHLAKHLLQKVTLKTICTSPLKRSKMTAEIVNLEHNFQLIEIEELKEFIQKSPYRN